MRVSRLAALMLLLAACGGGDATPEGAAVDSAGGSDGTAADSGAGGLPFDTTGASGLIDPESADAAAETVRAYYDAIEAGDYGGAYALWSGDGQASGQTAEAFRQGFAETGSVDAEVGAPGRVGAAAGSRYVDVPLALSARTKTGQRQCFAGTYTLRRSVVDGATEAQRAWRIASASVKEMEREECAQRLSADTETQIAATVTALGRELSKVSLLAPADVVDRDLLQRYGPYVTVALLDSWRQAPERAPGRRVSSPWPDRIEIRNVQADGDRFRVTGEVVYVTSAGPPGQASDRRAVELVVLRDGGWRVGSWSGG